MASRVSTGKWWSPAGDARRLYSVLEVAASLAGDNGAITAHHVAEAAQGKSLLYDKAGDEHYGVVSAFIKSMRGSDPDAAEAARLSREAA